MAARGIAAFSSIRHLPKSHREKNLVTYRTRNISSSASRLHRKNYSSTFKSLVFYHRPVLIFCRTIGSTGSKVDKDGAKQKVDLQYVEQKVRIFTCEHLYQKWKTDKKYWFVPNSGVYATLTYIDTMFTKNGKSEKITESSPTVLCIHGIPGNYGVFSHLLTEFTNYGVRAIVPNFPDVLYLPGKSKDQLFRHSAEEKTQMFQDFLKAINVSRVDAIVAHSSAIYPALNLALDPALKVKCQILFNTGGHKKTITMKPFSVVCTCSYLYLHPWGRVFIQKTGKFIMKYILRSPIKDDNLDGIMLLAITMVFSEYWKTKEQFREIVRRQFPTLLCFSEDDKVVERKLTYEVISLLDASTENISYYDENVNLKSKGKDKPWLRILSFEKGSHYVFRKHPEICNKETLNMLQKHAGLCVKDNKMKSVQQSEFQRNNSSMEIGQSFQNGDMKSIETVSCSRR